MKSISPTVGLIDKSSTSFVPQVFFIKYLVIVIGHNNISNIITIG
jgi:hypothetical protein